MNATDLAKARGGPQHHRTPAPRRDGALSRGRYHRLGDHLARLPIGWYGRSRAAAVLHNGLGNYQAALEAARSAVAHGHPGMSGLALPELVETAVRCGSPGVAESALAELRERTQAGGDA